MAGEAVAETFMAERIRSTNTDFFKPLKALRLRQFGDRQKKTVTSKATVLKNDRNLFSRLIVVMKFRHVDLREILKYSLGPVSYPLASADGSIAKTNKASLLSAIESEMNGSHLITSAHLISSDSALMVDAMALLQSLQVTRLPATMGDLATVILKQLFSLATYHHATRVDFVTDQYPSISIKNAEREKRAATGHEIINIYAANQSTPRQWKKFLSHGKNKVSLVRFLCQAWERSTMAEDMELYVCVGQTVKRLCYQSGLPPTAVEVEELRCDHEEADTRLLLHAAHAADAGHKSVVIRSPDTDVAVIAIHHQNSINAALYFATGTKDKARIFSITVICDKLGPALCNALVGLHCFSGCDSTSAFYGKGKRSVLTVARKDPSHLEVIT